MVIDRDKLKKLTKKHSSAEEALESMKEIFNKENTDGWDDKEVFHSYADDLMCNVLEELGYSEMVDFYIS